MAWTPETLKEYVDRFFEEQRRQIGLSLEASKDATRKAEDAAADRRHDSDARFARWLASAALLVSLAAAVIAATR